MPYALSAGALTSAFMNAVRDGKIYGNRCGSCDAVYVPPRAFCARCWRACDGSEPVQDRGRIVSYVIVNVPFYGQQVRIPYVLAWILLDGASSPILHLVGRQDDGGDVATCEVAVGMPVVAVWRQPSQRTGFINEDIDHFEPA